VLSFDAGAARQAEPGVMNANAKEPAVALAQSILSDEAVSELAQQAGVPFNSNKSKAAEFRSRLDMAQTSAGLLRVNYKDTDKKLSAAVANAVANMLVAWIPASVVATATSAPAQSGARLAKPAFAKSGRQRHPLHSRSHEQRELERQVAVADRKLTALYARAFAAQKSDVEVRQSATDNERRRILESQLSAAQKKLDELRARYTDEYPDVERAKDDIAEIRRKLASLPPVSNEAEQAASPPKLDADANEIDQVRLERVRLTQAILVEKRRETGLRDQTASNGGNSALAVPRQSLNPVAGQIWQRPFTLVRLAGDAVAGRSESGLSWYWPLAGILCGLLYLSGAIWRYRPIARVAPVVNNTLTAERATEYAGNFINTEDRWAKEVLESLSLTGVGHEDEAFAARHKPLAVNSQQQVDRGAPPLPGQAHYDEVLAVVGDNIDRNPNSRMAHSKKPCIALTTGDADTAIKATKLGPLWHRKR
jgi:hypothetical protein